jgi:hypothetical protein
LNLPDDEIGKEAPEAREELSEDEDNKHKEVLTLGRINTQSQRQVSWYYTAEEIQEGTNVSIDNEEIDVVGKVVIKGGDSILHSLNSLSSEDEASEPEFDLSEDEFNDDIDGDSDGMDENIA